MVLVTNEALVGGGLPVCMLQEDMRTQKPPSCKQSDGKSIKFLCGGGIFILTEKVESALQGTVV